MESQNGSHAVWCTFIVYPKLVSTLFCERKFFQCPSGLANGCPNYSFPPQNEFFFNAPVALSRDAQLSSPCVVEKNIRGTSWPSHRIITLCEHHLQMMDPLKIQLLSITQMPQSVHRDQSLSFWVHWYKTLSY